MGRVYKFKKRPYKHQVAAIKKLLSTGWGGALLMEPRTGKTKVAIDYMGILHMGHDVNRVLIVGPVVATQVWIDQLKENMPYKYRLTVWDRKGRKRFDLPKYGQNILDIVIINYDAFSTPGAWQKDRKTGKIKVDRYGNKMRSRSRGGRYDIKRKIIDWAPQLIIADEMHRLKSPSAKKSSALHSIGPVADYRLGLTGTVVTKSKRIYDVYSQWKFLNPKRFEGMTFADFKSEYTRELQMNGYKKFLGPRHVEQLHELIHMDSFSITREECYDLPPVTTQIIPVQLEESLNAYVQMAEDMVARIHTGEISEASIRLVQTLRLQQITSGFTKTSPSPEHPNGRLVTIGDEKLRAIRERLEDLLEMDEKVVIGALFKADIQRLRHMVAEVLKVPTYVISGGVKPADRARIPSQFNKTRGGAVFIGQPAAAGEAIDLSSASILQWYSLPGSWVQFTQFSDRIALSDKPKFHEFYLAAGTVDYLRYETLREDGDIGKKIIQSPERLLDLGLEWDY